MVDSPEAKRIQQTNYERQMLASSRGWGFAPDAPELLGRWPVKPFSENGDKRMAFGVVSGAVNGAPFTAFDFHRRTKLTHVGSLPIDIVVVKTVWVLTLPAILPKFEIFDSAEPEFDKTGAVPPQTADHKVNRSYLLVGTDLGLANQVLTPAVTGVMKRHKLVNWSTYGNQLLCVKHPIFGRVKPDELASKVGELAQLISVLPPHLWRAPQYYPHPPQGYR